MFLYGFYNIVLICSYKIQIEPFFLQPSEQWVSQTIETKSTNTSSKHNIIDLLGSTVMRPWSVLESLEFLLWSQWVPRVVDLPRMPNPSSKWISTKYPFSNTQEALLLIGNIGFSVDLLEFCQHLPTSLFVWFPMISSKRWNINISRDLTKYIHDFGATGTHRDIMTWHRWHNDTCDGQRKRLEQYAVASAMIMQLTNMSRQNALSPVYTNKHMKHTESLRVVIVSHFSAQKAVIFSLCLRFVWDRARWSRCTEIPSYESQKSGHRQNQFHMFFPLAYWLSYLLEPTETKWNQHVWNVAWLSSIIVDTIVDTKQASSEIEKANFLNPSTSSNLLIKVIYQAAKCCTFCSWPAQIAPRRRSKLCLDTGWKITACKQNETAVSGQFTLLQQNLIRTHFAASMYITSCRAGLDE